MSASQPASSASGAHAAETERGVGGAAGAEPAASEPLADRDEAGTHASDATADVETQERLQPRRLTDHPVVRAGVYAWALVGLLAAAVLVAVAVGALRLVVVPLLLALFPAALLAPVVRGLRRLRVPAALAALLTLLGSLAVLVGVGTLMVPQVAAEIPALTESVQEGVGQVEAFIDETQPFGLDAPDVRQQIDEAVQEVDWDAVTNVLRTGALGAAAAIAETVGMTVLLIVVLFFYLKDGPRLGRWLCGLFPAQTRGDAQAVGERAWNTVGAYFRGQLLVAFVDAVGIGLGLWLLGVPLALPLAVLVFFGGLFPIVGAFVTGVLAVLVALAAVGPLAALIVLGIVVGVQQLESNVLAPVVLGRATALHPLAVLTAITAGAILLGVLGAFLAVPVTASIVRGLSVLRERRSTPSGSEPVAATTGPPAAG